MFDRVRGALYGVAVGDALGGPLEFKSAEYIKNKYGRVTEMIGGGWLDLKPGETTDDTAMTLAVARGILKNPADPVPYVGQEFLKWAGSNPKDIGGTCTLAFNEAVYQNAESREDWLYVGCSVSLMTLNNAGNGALMRSVYPALWYVDDKQAIRVAEDIARMTHDNPVSTDIVKQYVELIYKAVNGRGFKTALRNIKIDKKAHPTGYAVNTWSHVIQSLRATKSFEEAVIEAVNRGGDTDTIGAITGSIAGAYYGFNAIPERWVKALDDELKAELDFLAEKVFLKFRAKEVCIKNDSKTV